MKEAWPRDGVSELLPTSCSNSVVKTNWLKFELLKIRCYRYEIKMVVVGKGHYRLVVERDLRTLAILKWN